MTTRSPRRAEAVHLDEQLVERLLALGVVVRAARAADGVDLVDEDDRRARLARLGEQAPDAGGAEAGEHLDERGGGLGEELRAGLAGDGLGQQRLAGARAGRAAGSPSAPARRARANRSGSRRNSTTSVSSALASSAPATSSQPIEDDDSGLICCGFVRGISFIVRQMKNTSRPMKMIGAHVMIQLSTWYHSSPANASMLGMCASMPAGRGSRPGSGPYSANVLRAPRRAGSPRARRGRPRAGARPARACRSAAGSRSRGA